MRTDARPAGLECLLPPARPQCTDAKACMERLAGQLCAAKEDEDVGQLEQAHEQAVQE